MAETGVLHPDARFELLDGQIFDSSQSTFLRSSVTASLAERFFKLPEQGFIVAVRHPVQLDEFSEVQPDVALIKHRADYHKTRQLQPGDVFLLIEVADTELEYDREEKLPAYARAGIVEVWIVNLNERTVEVYRKPHLTGYGSQTILRPGNQAAPLAFPNAAVDVAKLLKR